MNHLLTLLLLLPTLLWSSIKPWGKDACLAYLPKTHPKESPHCYSIADTLINFHHDTISPSDGPRSNFSPTSSYYTQEAMRKYGFFTGFYMGCDRLMRENQDPWVYRKTRNKEGNLIKWDPVK